ncbi:hypothetical protein [Pengzhenrongella sp.]|uniref:hypothetical protein n=1 Tax=Pengzhenrongella sp. TaxID=2888820 RepID=UPI002F942A82
MSQRLAGRWALPTIESNSNSDGVVRLQVSVSVPEVYSLFGTPVAVALVAGGEGASWQVGESGPGPDFPVA